MQPTDLQKTDELPDTFDKTVVAMSGFGGHHDEVAFYVDGHLLVNQESRFLGESLNQSFPHGAYEQLARHFAQAAGYQWLERQASPVWQQTSWVTPPSELTDYAALTVERYRAVDIEVWLQNTAPNMPVNGMTEPWTLSTIYGLLGGSASHEKEWMAQFLEDQGGAFVSAFEELFDAVQLGIGQSPDTRKRVAADAAYAELAVRWMDRLRAAIASEKQLTPLAKRAFAG